MEVVTKDFELGSRNGMKGNFLSIAIEDMTPWVKEIKVAVLSQ